MLKPSPAKAAGFQISKTLSGFAKLNRFGLKLAATENSRRYIGLDGANSELLTKAWPWLRSRGCSDPCSSLSNLPNTAFPEVGRHAVRQRNPTPTNGISSLSTEHQRDLYGSAVSRPIGLGIEMAQVVNVVVEVAEKIRLY